MKITIHPTTGELSFDIDAHNQAEVNQAITFALGIQGGNVSQPAAPVRAMLVFADPDEDDETPVDLLSPGGNAATHHAAAVSDDERIAAGLQTREQRETWLYLRRNDRVRGVALAGLASRFKLSSTAASARACALMKLGYAVRIGKGYYRATVPDED